MDRQTHALACEKKPSIRLSDSLLLRSFLQLRLGNWFMGSYKGSFKGPFKGIYRDSIRV